MVICELDSEISASVLGWKVPSWQAVLLHRVLPSCGGLAVYLTLMCFDFALVFEHFKNGDNGLAIFCIILMIIPAVLSLVFSFASPPPGLQTEESAFAVVIQSSDLHWIFIQILNFILFPVAALGRYCHQIFWWMEVVCASYSADEDRTKEALRRVRAPSPLELYLFLQSFVHAAPHAVVNILNLMNSPITTFDKVSLQSVSIIASSLRMASTAAVYRRFEREKICGRRYPWRTTVEDQENAANETTEKQENIYEELVVKQPLNSSRRSNLNSDLIQFSPPADDISPFFDDDSDLGSAYLSPVPIEQINNTNQAESDSDEEYVRPVSIIDRVAPRRRDTQYTIEPVQITPPPAIPAPRPMSLAVWADKMMANAEAIPTWLSAPPRSKYHEEVIQDEPDIPRYVPRKYIRGLEPQDATALLVQFLGWYMFFVARLLSLSAFINFHPFVAIVVLFSHYQIMLLFLIVPKASTVRRSFYIFLAFIYLFCLMEFKIRFRHVRVWHVFWMAVCTVETIVFTALWSTINNDLNSWWRDYVVIVIFGSTLLSYMCLTVYFVILKPNETIVYVDKKATDS